LAGALACGYRRTPPPSVVKKESAHGASLVKRAARSRGLDPRQARDDRAEKRLGSVRAGAKRLREQGFRQDSAVVDI